MKKFAFIPLFLLLAVSLSAQKYSTESFDLDTATNSETLTFTFDEVVNYPADYMWQVDGTVLSGSLDSVKVEVYASSIYGSSDPYNLVSSTMNTSTADQIVTGQAYGVRYQLKVTTYGTVSYKCKVGAVFKERQ